MKASKKQLKKQLDAKPVTMTRKERDKMQMAATKNAVAITQLFPLWVLRTEFKFGEKRIKQFMAAYSDLIDSYNKGYITLADIVQQLEEETGIRLNEEEAK